MRRLTKKKQFQVLADEFRALEPYRAPIFEPLRVSIDLRILAKEFDVLFLRKK